MRGCTKDPDNGTYAPPVALDNANSEAKAFGDYTELKWSDEFDSGSLDQTKWSYEVQDVWYNNELQATTNSVDNLFLDNGNLVIQARQQQLNGRDYTSARIVTRDKKSFGFGRIDVRAKLPQGKGIWPAIWMLGTNEATAPWPACGEIDIMELRGSNPSVNLSTVHYGADFDSRKYTGTSYTLPNGSFADGFHVFTLIRSQDKNALLRGWHAVLHPDPQRNITLSVQQPVLRDSETWPWVVISTAIPTAAPCFRSRCGSIT